MAKIAFYCSYLGSRPYEGQQYCWPVEVVRDDGRDAFVYVRGLAGRFKGRSFSVSRNEITSYVPKRAKLAPGAAAFRPSLQYGPEFKVAERVRAKVSRIPYVDGMVNPHASPKQVLGLLRQLEKAAVTLEARTPGDPAWQFYRKDFTQVFDAADAGREREKRT